MPEIPQETETERRVCEAETLVHCNFVGGRWGWTEGVVVLHGEFTFEQLRVLADLLEEGRMAEYGDLFNA